MFSPLLFNFLVNSLAAAIRRVSPGVRLLPVSDFRFTCQFYADDFLVLVESEYYLQHALTARILWGQQWRFLLRMGSEKSAAMVFGRARSRPSCSVFLSGQLLLVVSSYRYFGVVLISSLRLDGPLCPSYLSRSPVLRAKHFVGPLRRLPIIFLHISCSPCANFFSATIGAEFVGDYTRSLAQLDFFITTMRISFGWASGTPSVSVFNGFALPRHFPRVYWSFGFVRPIPCILLRNSRASHRYSFHSLIAHTRHIGPIGVYLFLQHHAAGDFGQFGVGPRCSLTVTLRWLVTLCWLQRVVCPLWIALGFVVYGAVSVFPLQCPFYSGSCVPTHSTDRFATPASIFASFARHGHDPCPGGRGARHRGDVSSCAFCTSRVGDLTHCLTCCPCFCRLACPVCSRSLCNGRSTLGFSIRRIWPTPRCTVRAHIQFVGQV